MRHYVNYRDPRGHHGQCWTLGCLEIEGGCGMSVDGDSEDETVAKWNRRTILAPPFAEAWKIREAAGYQYGCDALASVIVGYELALEVLRSESDEK